MIINSIDDLKKISKNPKKHTNATNKKSKKNIDILLQEETKKKITNYRVNEAIKSIQDRDSKLKRALENINSQREHEAKINEEMSKMLEEGAKRKWEKEDDEIADRKKVIELQQKLLDLHQELLDYKIKSGKSGFKWKMISIASGIIGVIIGAIGLLLVK